MDKTYLDQMVEYPAKIISKIVSDAGCASLILNKSTSEITEDDVDLILDKYIFDYQYVDNTVQETGAFIWAEVEIPSVENRTIKDVRLYVTVSCHKNYMKLSSDVFPGVMGNRRDNLVRYIDRLLNNAPNFGIGTLALRSVTTLTNNNGFTARELTYDVPDFNLVDIET